MASHLTLAFCASLSLLTVVASAQEPAAPPVPSTTVEFDAEGRPVEWHGLIPENLVVRDPSAVGTRDLRADDPMIKPFLDLLGVYTRFVDDNLTGFDGKESQREAGFHAVNVVMVTGVVWPPTLAACGAAIGAIALSESGPGAIAGGIAGGTIGGVAGTAAMCGQLLLAVGLAMHVNDKYPTVQSRDLAAADGSDLPAFDTPEEWLLEDLRHVEGTTSNGNGDDVASRSLDGGRVLRATATRQKYAGPYESLFLHMVADVVTPQADALSRSWDRTPGLSSAHRQALAAHSGLRPLVERIAYIRSARRLTAHSLPALPLSGWQKSVTRVLRGDTRELQQMMLDAFAVGRTRLEVDGNTMTWATPSALRKLGAPAKLTAPVASVSARVNGFGGSIAAQIVPRKFAVELGSMQAVGQRLRVGFEIARGRIVDVRLQCDLGPTRQSLNASPRLTKALTGHLEFVLDGFGLKLVAADLGDLRLDLDMPKLPPVLKPIEGLVDGIEKEIRKSVEKLLLKQLGFDRIFDGIERHVPQRMLDLLNAARSDFGLASITKLHRLELSDGKLGARVDAQEWSGVPNLAPMLARHAAALKRLGR
jgi:hypothetical protein